MRSLFQLSTKIVDNQISIAKRVERIEKKMLELAGKREEHVRNVQRIVGQGLETIVNKRKKPKFLGKGKDKGRSLEK